MPLFSKARPRLTRSGHAYMPQAYKDAQAEMRRQLTKQWSGEPLSGPVALYLCVHGEARADSDNIAGALMDAANGILWTDDRVSIISTLVVEWSKASKAESRWIIKIAELT
jgi:Holliday junction resolvase RusA-like endonuclease